MKYENRRMIRFPRILLVLCIASMLAITGGCGSKSSGKPNSSASETSADTGVVFISLTDNQGDFGSYSVDVVSIELQKANGAIVKTLPLATRVDFAQYVEMTEFLTACTIPSGTYVKASMTLDFTDADITVEDALGNYIEVSPENILDEAGSRIEEISVSIQLDELNRLTIKPGVPAHLAMDFDLKASNEVEWQGSIPVITVSPLLLADIESHHWKTTRIRGPIDDVHPEAGYFDVIIRPFVHAIHHGDFSNRFGTARVYTDENTTYVINGTQYQGKDGIEALGGMVKYSAVMAFGDFIKETGRIKFKAKEVLAGSSIAGGDMDLVSGNVIKRTGDIITLRGASLSRDDGTLVFHNTVEVDLKDVKAGKQYSKSIVSTGDISIGQRLLIFGTLDDAMKRMDAEYAHLFLTVANGIVASKSNSILAVNLNSIDRRNICIFDFSGTPANPENYLVGTGALSLAGITEGMPLKAVGFPVPFGYAENPGYDFTAWSLINVANVKGVLCAGWGKEGNAEVIRVTSSGVELDLEDSGYFHHLNRAGVVTDLKELGKDPRIEPEGKNGVFCIKLGEELKVHYDLDAFLAALSSNVKSGRRLRHIVSTGKFSDADAVMSGRFIAVTLK